MLSLYFSGPGEKTINKTDPVSIGLLTQSVLPVDASTRNLKKKIFFFFLGGIGILRGSGFMI